MVRSLKGAELQYKFIVTRLIHQDGCAARILAATMNVALSPEQISKKCNISLEECHRLIRKLKDSGLIKPVKKVMLEDNPDDVVFLYKAQLNGKYIRFEKGRFRVVFPAVFRLTNGKKIVIKEFIKSSSM